MLLLLFVALSSRIYYPGKDNLYIYLLPYIMSHELVKNWHQSAGCVKAKRVWDDLKVNGIHGGFVVVESELRNGKKTA